MKLIYTTIFSILFFHFSFAESRVDSLLQVLQIGQQDTNMVKTLEVLSWEYHRTHPEKTIDFATRSLLLAEELNYTLGTIKAKNVLAVGYSIQGNIDEAFTIFMEVIELAESTNNHIHLCRTYNNLGRTYMKIGDFEKAVDFYQKGAKCSERFGLQQQMSDNLLNMAAAMQEQGVWDTALEYAKEALEIATTLNDENLLCDAHKLLGISYSQKNDFKEALNHLEPALKLSQIRKDKVGSSSIYNQLGKIYSKQNQFKKALLAHRTAYQLASEIQYQEQMITALEHLAEIYQKNKQYLKSIEKCKEGIQLAENLGTLKKVTKLYELLAKNYAELDDYSSAYVFHTKLKILSDSLSIQEKNQKLEELKIQFQLEHKEAENQLLKAQQAKDQLTIQKANIVSYTFVIALLCIGIITFLLFKRFREKQSQSRILKKEVVNRTRELEKINTDLKKSNKEMERFNHIASHDLKEPLRNIISFTKLLEMRLKNQKDQVADEYLSFVVTNAKQMNTLIEDVLEFSKFSNRKIKMEEVDLNKNLQQVLTTLQPLLEEKTAHILSEDLPVIRSNSAQIYILLRNIIENSIIYNNHPTPIIEVDYHKENFKHHISITDNGIGIDPAYHQQIFDMFKRLHSRQDAQGSGLGLSVCKKIVHRLGGEILVKSAPSEGSTFTIIFPVDSDFTKESTKKKQPVFKVLSS